MKKAFLVVLAIIIIVTTVMTVEAKAATKKDIYPASMIVIEVENNIVTLEDFNGYTWEFEGAEDWQVGDICACIMNDNGTDKIFDDEIVQTKYCGFVK